MSLLYCRYGKTTKKAKNGHGKTTKELAPPLVKTEAATTPPAAGAGSEAGPLANEETKMDEDLNRNMLKTQAHIKKLEKALRQCGRKIQQLDEAEMDLDALEDENSPYLMMTRYYL